MGSIGEAENVPAKTRNCSFQLINLLFGDEKFPKFEKVEDQKISSLLTAE